MIVECSFMKTIKGFEQLNRIFHLLYTTMLCLLQLLAILRYLQHYYYYIVLILLLLLIIIVIINLSNARIITLGI